LILDIVRKENLPHDKNVDKSKIFKIKCLHSCTWSLCSTSCWR